MNTDIYENWKHFNDLTNEPELKPKDKLNWWEKFMSGWNGVNSNLNNSNDSVKNLLNKNKIKTDVSADKSMFLLVGAALLGFYLITKKR